jgi:hypothetical protein
MEHATAKAGIVSFDGQACEPVILQRLDEDMTYLTDPPRPWPARSTPPRPVGR